MDLVNFDVYVNEDLTITIQTDRKSAERAFTGQFSIEKFYIKYINFILNIYIFYKNIYIYIEKYLYRNLYRKKNSLYFCFLDNAYLQEITNQELNKLNIKTANEIKQSESSENNVKQSQCENEGMSMQRRFLLLILHNFKFIPYILSKIFLIYRKKYIVMVTE